MDRAQCHFCLLFLGLDQRENNILATSSLAGIYILVTRGYGISLRNCDPQISHLFPSSSIGFTSIFQYRHSLPQSRFKAHSMLGEHPEAITSQQRNYPRSQ